ncbi:MAG TPA: hypothetical protein ENH10_03320 [Bacteroidetes bacterium]|nr:hypothetical protein BMS3Bbin04_01922 [bacterium BMS3Bbin04]HDO65047.1 hypothetical protein [Bacteroidota bacterium]HEX04172.1 hypothetical protein [Bacteroidota bacterium]
MPDRATKAAANILIGILGLLGVFHVLVIVGVVPSDIVMGGQADTSLAQLLALELTALGTTILFMVITVARAGYILKGLLPRFIRVAAWFMFAYFVLNIAGNFIGGPGLEMFVFGPLSIVIAMLALIVARGK